MLKRQRVWTQQNSRTQMSPLLEVHWALSLSLSVFLCVFWLQLSSERWDEVREERSRERHLPSLSVSWQLARADHQHFTALNAVQSHLAVHAETRCQVLQVSARFLPTLQNTGDMNTHQYTYTSLLGNIWTGTYRNFYIKITVLPKGGLFKYWSAHKRKSKCRIMYHICWYVHIPAQHGKKRMFSDASLQRAAWRWHWSDKCDTGETLTSARK